MIKIFDLHEYLTNLINSEGFLMLDKTRILEDHPLEPLIFTVFINFKTLINIRISF